MSAAARFFFESQHRVIGLDGEWRWFFTRGRVTERDETGAPLRHAGAFLDITEYKASRLALEQNKTLLEKFVNRRTRQLFHTSRRLVAEMISRRHTEKKLAHTRDRFRLLFEQSIDAIAVLTGPIFKFLVVNQAFLELFGYSEKEILSLIGDDVFQLVHPDDREMVRQHLSARFRRETPANRYEARILTKTGQTRWVSVSATLFKAGGEMLTQAIYHDITDRKRRENIAAAKGRLLEKVNVCSVNEFLQFTIDEVEALTESRIGFYRIATPGRPGFFLQVWSSNTKGDACKIGVADYHVPKDGGGVWMDCIHSKTPVIYNNYKALEHRKPLPEGYPVIIREMMVPILRAGEIAALLGVGNKPVDYGPEDAEVAQTLADLAWDLTVAIHMKTKLAESEARFRNLAENAQDTIYRMLIPEGRYDYVSPSAARIFGHPPKHWYENPKLIRELIHPDWLDFFETEWAGHLAGKKPPVVEYPILHPALGLRWLHQRNVLILDKEGNPAAMEGIVTDITDRKRLEQAELELKRRAEEKLRESEEKYRRIFNHAPVGIFHSDAKGVVVAVNDCFLEMFGVSREWMLGFDMQQQLQNETLREMVSAVLKGEIRCYEGPCVSLTGGRSIFCKAEFMPVFQDNGAPNGFVCVIEDTSERVRAANAIRESEEKYRGLAERLTDIVLLTDLEGRPYYVSPSARVITGFAPEELMGRPPGDFMTPSDAAKIKEAMAGMAAGGGPVSVWAHSPIKDGRLAYIEWSGSPIFSDGAIKGFQFLGRDQTPRRAAEEALRQSRENLRHLSAHLQASREQDRKRIARDIHDTLGQVLTAIKMDAAWLKKRVPKNRKPDLEKIEGMMGLVDDTIAAVRRICAELRPPLLDDLGLVPAMEAMVAEFQKRGNISVRCCFPENVKGLEDETATALFRIFQEILTNISRHSGAEAVKVSLILNKDSIELTVTDDGVGISEAQRQNPKSFGIMGMMERARSLGGEIHLLGEQGWGTTVWVKLPLRGGAETRGRR